MIYVIAIESAGEVKGCVVYGHAASQLLCSYVSGVVAFSRRVYGGTARRTRGGHYFLGEGASKLFQELKEFSRRYSGMSMVIVHWRLD